MTVASLSTPGRSDWLDVVGIVTKSKAQALGSSNTGFHFAYAQPVIDEAYEEIAQLMVFLIRVLIPVAYGMKREGT